MLLEDELIVTVFYLSTTKFDIEFDKRNCSTCKYSTKIWCCLNHWRKETKVAHRLQTMNPIEAKPYKPAIETTFSKATQLRQTKIITNQEMKWWLESCELNHRYDGLVTAERCMYLTLGFCLKLWIEQQPTIIGFQGNRTASTHCPSSIAGYYGRPREAGWF